MNICVVAATQLIKESQTDTVMLEELFSEHTGLTSLTGKQVKSCTRSAIINHILLKFHWAFSLIALIICIYYLKDLLIWVNYSSNFNENFANFWLQLTVIWKCFR